MTTTWTELETLLDNFDGEIKLGRHSTTMWGGSLRLTLFDTLDGPATSATFFYGAQPTPEAVVVELLSEYKAWLLTTTTRPLEAGYYSRLAEKGA